MARVALVALLLGGTAAPALACNCFSPAMRERAARDTLAGARQVAFGRVTAVAADGAAEVEVTESFKGVAVGEVMPLAGGGARCPERRLAAGERVLVLVHDAPPQVCGTYPDDHFLLPEFRRMGPLLAR